jgi:26S proteasome regulatory subunit N6
MLLCKIMVNATDDIGQILTHKAAVRYSGRDIDAMRAVAAAYKERSLKSFTSVQQQYQGEIGGDVVVSAHLAELYSKLLEQNLLRIIEPYSCVEIAHVAHLIDLPVLSVERKLSQMILDKRFDGVLDAANGCLHVWDKVPEEASFTATLDTIAQMNKVVSSLFENCAALN